MTITEALAEIKTIQKRLEKKQEAIRANIGRDARLKDPLEKEGGSQEFIKRERQSISDLEMRLVAIRTAIIKSNLETKLTVKDTTKSVSEWLTWRREVSENKQRFLNNLNASISGLRQQAQRLQAVRNPVDPAQAAPADVVIHLEEKALIGENEELEAILGELDGKFSLLNATTTIAF